MPTVNNPEEEYPIMPPLPQWTSEERALWLDLLEAYSVSLLPSDEDSISHASKRDAALEAVQLGARLADMAVREFQFRLYAQSGQDEKEGMAAEVSFERFAAWLERSRAVRKARPVTARRKR
jgi:hypothetical protein